MSQFNISMYFSVCQKIATSDDIKDLGHMLAENGFYPSSAFGGEEVTKTTNIDLLVEDRYKLLTGSQEEGYLVATAAFPIYIEDRRLHNVHCAFQFNQYRDARVSISLGGGGRTREAEQSAIELFAEQILRISICLYSLAEPQYGYILDHDKEQHPWHDKAVLRREIPALNWINLFGPRYVEKYGIEFFRGIPGYHLQQLADGGVLYQSRPAVLITDEIAYKRWQKAVTAYMSMHNIKLRFNSF